LALRPPSGEEWLHEIKHDGFRIIARKDDKREA
jgi:ATP-dependent DNA ligase